MGGKISLEEQINPEAMNVALLREIQKHMISMNEDLQAAQSELEIIRRNQEKNTVQLKYKIDLSKARTDEKIADFEKEGIEVDSMTVLKLPSSMSFKISGMAGEVIELETGESVSITNQKITRLLVTNEAGSGTARVHVFGRSL